MQYVITRQSNFGETVLTKDKTFLNIKLKAHENCEDVKFFTKIEDAQDLLGNIFLLSNFPSSDFFIKEAKKYGSRLLIKEEVYFQSHKDTEFLVEKLIKNYRKF